MILFHQFLKPKNNAGFTLVEISIVSVIIGLIIVIGLPSYLASQKKSHRIDAQLIMQKIALSIEQYYNRKALLDSKDKSKEIPQGYLGYTIEAEYGNACFPTAHNCNEQHPEIYYFFSVDLETDYYSITATPKNSQASDDCGTLKVDILNAKTLINSAPNTSLKECW